MIEWQSLFATYGLVFLAELGDKTQLAVVAQTCKFRSPWAVFTGGSLALTAVTAIGAIGGKVLNELIPANVIRIAAAIAFVVMGIIVWLEARKAAQAANACSLDESCEVAEAPRWSWKAFGATFSLLFVAELGDKTQLAVLGLASKQESAALVFAGGALALTTVTALGVIGGQQLCRLVPEHTLMRISAVAFVVLGILMGVGIL